MHFFVGRGKHTLEGNGILLDVKVKLAIAILPCSGTCIAGVFTELWHLRLLRYVGRVSAVECRRGLLGIGHRFRGGGDGQAAVAGYLRELRRLRDDDGEVSSSSTPGGSSSSFKSDLTVARSESGLICSRSVGRRPAVVSTLSRLLPLPFMWPANGGKGGAGSIVGLGGGGGGGVMPRYL